LPPAARATGRRCWRLPGSTSRPCRPPRRLALAGVLRHACGGTRRLGEERQGLRVEPQPCMGVPCRLRRPARVRPSRMEDAGSGPQTASVIPIMVIAAESLRAPARWPGRISARPAIRAAPWPGEAS
jgi:hypothetical protein